MMRRSTNKSYVLYVFYYCAINVFLCGKPLQETTAALWPAQCTTQMDVAFAIDASYSVAPVFHRVLEFVKEFSSRVPLSAGSFRISVTQFSTDARIEFSLLNGTSLDGVYMAIDSIKYNAGSTQTGMAFRVIREQVFTEENGDRSDVPNVVILVTDGPASDHETFISESHRLDESGALVFAVGLGYLTDPQELKAVAGNNVFSTTQLEDVANLSQSIITRICEVFGQDIDTNSSPYLSTDDLTTTTHFSETTAVPQSSIISLFPKDSSLLLDLLSTTEISPPTTFRSSNQTAPTVFKDCCISEAVDIVFVVDSSKNVGPSKFLQIQSFLMNFLGKLQANSTSTHRIGIIQYSDDAVKVMSLGYANSNESIQQAVSATRYTGGNSNLAAALNVLESEVLTTPRYGVARIGVIITGGLSTQSSLARLYATMLHHNGVNIFAVGVGDHVSNDELSVLASEPRDDHIFIAQNLTTTNDVLNNMIPPLCIRMLDLTRKSTNSTQITQQSRHETTFPQRNNSHNDTSAPLGTNDCGDRFDNCIALTNEECQEDVMWAESNCAESCGYCLRNDASDKINSSKCMDSIPNCPDYGEYICHDSSYNEWTRKHCSKYCQLCDLGGEHELSGTLIISNTTSPFNGSPHNYTTVCKDLLPDCESYGGPSVCHSYTAWASVRCQRYCGFCTVTNPTRAQEIHDSKRCPRWRLPAECSLETVEWSQCPMPSCPDG